MKVPPFVRSAQDFFFWAPPRPQKSTFFIICGYCCVTRGNIFQISSLEEKVTHYALKVAEHEKNALLSKKEHQNLKKELEEHLLFKEKYERLEN